MLEIRATTPSDAETILSFVRALAEYERQPEAVQVDAATLRAQLEAPHPPFECLLAELDGATVGFALFFHSYSTWRGKRGVWLEDLFVLPSARRHGVGAALLRRVAQIARERDCARFEWCVLDWNETAISFYKKLGADVLGEWRLCRVSDAALAQLGTPEA
ncbi:MAG TPA: GNAT family N-acetyltransferase [Polyangiaceae bacterium]